MGERTAGLASWCSPTSSPGVEDCLSTRVEIGRDFFFKKRFIFLMWTTF